MTISLTDYSSRKIIAEQEQAPAEIDFKKESLINPVIPKWTWQFKSGSGNILNRSHGIVLVKDGWGQIVKKRRFISRQERNKIVNGYLEAFKGKAHHFVYVEFD